MNSEELAWKIAKYAFKDKVDLSGNPYIEHLKSVVNGVSNENSDYRITAILHDLLEDCESWNEDILTCFFFEEIVDAVVSLTKIKGERYEDYLLRVKSNHIARKVKISDLIDNMDIKRLNEIKDKDIIRLKKYHKAYNYLIT